MRGAVLPGKAQVELREFPTPEPGNGQVLVRMQASGLCGSDLRAIYHEHTGSGAERYQGCIAGHEPCGRIEAVGPDMRHFAVGDRVVVYHIVGCGFCDNCRRGFMIGCTSPQRAAYGWQRDGGHADYLLAEERTLLSLPDELSYVDGALVACGHATAYQALLRADVSGRDRVLVVGLGPVGLAVTQLALASGAEVMGVDLLPSRLEFARTVGAAHVLAANDQTAAAIEDLTHGRGSEVGIDCSGSGAGRRLCLEVARDWGRVVYIGEGGTVTFEPSPFLLHKQLTLMGSWVTGIVEMGALLQFLARHALHPEEIVTNRYALADAGEAYRAFDSGTPGKTVIVWPQ